LQAATVRQAAARRDAATPAALWKTPTLDNGKEFAEHEQLEVEAALRIYFAKPYCAWQRGTNDNTNGLVRQFFPKGRRGEESARTISCPVSPCAAGRAAEP